MGVPIIKGPAPKADAQGLTAGAVRTPAIAPGAVTTEKLGVDSVQQTHLAPDAVGPAELSAMSIEADKFIRSANYVAGTSGWAVDGSGTAEFNNVTVRGVFDTSANGTASGVKIDDNFIDLYDTGGSRQGRITVGTNLIRFDADEGLDLTSVGSNPINIYPGASELRIVTNGEFLRVYESPSSPNLIGKLFKAGTSALALQTVTASGVLSLQSDTEVRSNIRNDITSYIAHRAASFPTGSDRTFKKDIQPIDFDPESVLRSVALAARRYRLETAEADAPLQTGLIANDLPYPVRADDVEGRAGYDLNAIVAVQAMVIDALRARVRWLLRNAVIKSDSESAPS